VAETIGLVGLGLVVGTFGTLIGAGGGFLLVPVLLLLYPHDSPALITGMSLAVVFFNAGSGSFAYARMGRVDFKSGLMFAAATIPGAVLGAMVTAQLDRRTFDLLFGVLMTAGSIYLLWRPVRTGSDGPVARISGHFHRILVERDGTAHEFGYNPALGIGISVVVGFVSSLLGIGGGIIHVPVLSQLLGFPVHIATATSHFTLSIMALAGSLVHLVSGALAPGLGRIAALAVGVMVGAQAGARLSRRVHGVWIMRGLAIALGFVGLRILLGAV
jgi:uncharacterized membrane protein YfcA